MGSNSQFVAACAPGDLPVAVAQLFELEHGLGIELVEGAPLKQGLFPVQHGRQFGQEPGVDRTEGMHLLNASAPQQRRANRKNSLGCWGAQVGIEIPFAGIGFSAISAPAGMACFQRPQGFLERLLKAASDRHGFTHRFH